MKVQEKKLSTKNIPRKILLGRGPASFYATPDAAAAVDEDDDDDDSVPAFVVLFLLPLLSARMLLVRRAEFSFVFPSPIEAR